MDYLLYIYHSSNIAASAILILSLLHAPKFKLSKELVCTPLWILTYVHMAGNIYMSLLNGLQEDRKQT